VRLFAVTIDATTVVVVAVVAHRFLFFETKTTEEEKREDMSQQQQRQRSRWGRASWSNSLEHKWLRLCDALAKGLNAVLGDPNELQQQQQAITMPPWMMAGSRMFERGFRAVVEAGERRESTMWLLFVPVICVSSSIFGLYYVFFAVLLLFLLRNLQLNERRDQEFRKAFLRALINDSATSPLQQQQYVEHSMMTSSGSSSSLLSLSSSSAFVSPSNNLSSSTSGHSPSLAHVERSLLNAVDRENESWANRALAKWWRTSAQLFLSHHLPTVEEKINNVRPKFLVSILTSCALLRNQSINQSNPTPTSSSSLIILHSNL